MQWHFVCCGTAELSIKKAISWQNTLFKEVNSHKSIQHCTDEMGYGLLALGSCLSLSRLLNR